MAFHETIGDDDPRPSTPTDPSADPPIDEPSETPPPREEPDGGDPSAPRDAPMIA